MKKWLSIFCAISICLFVMALGVIVGTLQKELHYRSEIAQLSSTTASNADEAVAILHEIKGVQFSRNKVIDGPLTGWVLRTFGPTIASTEFKADTTALEEMADAVGPAPPQD